MKKVPERSRPCLMMLGVIGYASVVTVAVAGAYQFCYDKVVISYDDCPSTHCKKIDPYENHHCDFWPVSECSVPGVGWSATSEYVSIDCDSDGTCPPKSMDDHWEYLGPTSTYDNCF